MKPRLDFGWSVCCSDPGRGKEALIQKNISIWPADLLANPLPGGGRDRGNPLGGATGEPARHLNTLLFLSARFSLTSKNGFP